MATCGVPNTGSIVKATVTTVGSTAVIKCYVDGVLTINSTDTGPVTSGAPGIGTFNGYGSGAVNNGFGFSSFTATAEAVSLVPPLPPTFPLL